MRVGDILEWLAAICLVGACWLWVGAPLSLLAAAVCLVYMAQCYAGTPMAFGKATGALRRLSAARGARSERHKADERQR